MPEKNTRIKVKLKILLSKILVLCIIFLIGMILIKKDISYKTIIKKKIYEENIKFNKFIDLYEKYIGKVTSINNQQVFNESIIYTNKRKYLDGVELEVENNYMVPSLESGIVVYIGMKENYGNTIIVEQRNGIDVFYSNIKNDNIKLYDYIEKGTYIGMSNSNKIYLVFQENGEIIDYNEYI